MHGVTYLVAAYAIAWVGLFAYLAFLVMRVRNINTELVAVTELVREQQEHRKTHSNGHIARDIDQQTDTYTNMSGEN